MEKKRRFVPLSNALDQYLERSGLARFLLEERLRKQWSELMGAEAAKLAELVSLQDYRLRVRVANPVWRMELQHQRESIRIKANAVLGGELVREIILM